MAIYEIDAFEAAQVIEGLFRRKSMLFGKLNDENQSPFHLVLNTVCHA